MFSESDSEFDACRAIGEEVYWRIVVRQVVLALIPITVALAAGVWLVVYAITVLYQVPIWLSALVLVPLVPVAVRVLGQGRRERSVVTTRVLSPPAVFDHADALGWWLRISGLPLVALGAYHLVLDGWPMVAAIAVALLGWLSIDLAQIAIFPVRRTLYRLQVLTESTTVPGT